MANISEIEPTFRTSSAEKQLDNAPVVIERHVDERKPLFTTEAHDMGKGTHIVGVMLNGHEDDWRQSYDAECKFGSDGKLEWSIGNHVYPLGLVYLREGHDPIQLGVKKDSRSGVIEEYEPSDKLYVVDRRLVDVMRQTNTLSSEHLTEFMDEVAPIADIAQVSLKQKSETVVPTKPGFMNGNDKIRPYSLNISIRRLRSELLAAKDYSQIADIIKIGKNGDTFHREDGKFLSRHELQLIDDHQDQIRYGMTTRQAESVTPAEPEIDSDSAQGLAQPESVFSESESEAADGVTSLTASINSGRELVSIDHTTSKELVPIQKGVSTELVRIERDEPFSDKRESIWQRVKKRTSETYLKAGNLFGQILYGAGDKLPRPKQHENETDEEFERRVKRYGAAKVIGAVVLVVAGVVAVKYGLNHDGSSGGGGSVNHTGSGGTTIGHQGSIHNLDKFRIGNGPHHMPFGLDPNAPGVEVPIPQLHTPEASLYQGQFPWDWARDAFPGQNPMTALYHLADIARAHGNNVEFLPARGGGVYLQINGNSNTVDVINIFRPFAG